MRSCLVIPRSKRSSLGVEALPARRAPDSRPSNRLVRTLLALLPAAGLHLVPTAALAQAPSPPPQADASRAPAQPPPATTPRKPPPEPRGPYFLGQFGFAIPSAEPEGFHHGQVYDSKVSEHQSEGGGSGLSLGGIAGLRLAHGIGVGGLLLYTNAGGKGTLQQSQPVAGGSATLTHEGAARFRQRSLRLGPHARYMFGEDLMGDGSRFLVAGTLGAVYSRLDIDQPTVAVQGGALVQTGTAHPSYAGVNPYLGASLGMEFNPASTLLLGVSMETFFDLTAGIRHNPLDKPIQGYLGISVSLGFHLWAPSP